MRPQPERKKRPAFLAIIASFMLVVTLTLIFTNVCCAWNWNPLTWGQQRDNPQSLTERLLPTPGNLAQISLSPSATVEVKPSMNRYTFGVYDDRLSSVTTKAQVEVSAKTTLLNQFQLTYSVMPAVKWTNTETITGELRIGDIKFGKQESGEQATKTTLDCEYSGSMQRVELALLANKTFRPIVVGEFPAIRLDATGKIDDKVVTASDTFRQSLVGLGAELTFSPGYRFSEATLKGAFSDRLTLAEGKVGLNLLDYFRVSAGYRYHRMKMNNGVWTDQGAFIESGLSF